MNKNTPAPRQVTSDRW